MASADKLKGFGVCIVYSQGILMAFKLYDKNYKRLMILPAALTLVFLFVLFVYPQVTLGLDFIGGTRIIVNTDKLNEKEVSNLLTNELHLPEVKVTSVTSPLGSSTRIEYAEPKDLGEARILLDKAITNKNTPDVAVQNLTDALTTLGKTPISNDYDELVTQTAQVINEESQRISTSVRDALTSHFNLPTSTPFTTEEVAPTVGKDFLLNALQVAIASIVLLTIVIFIFFRELVPSLAIVEAALFDMLTAVAIATLLGFSFTLSTVASLLMLVGFSVDTDILLTTRLLKRKDKSVMQRCNDTLLTGLTVTSTVMGATLAMLIVSYFAQITVIFEISAVVLFGMIGDIVATWFTNAPILLWYWEKKNGSITEG